eukprot:TRINITY_DN2047_c0_g1_i1.p1 TRINITY_DN2047_c0_g1~~TRINITY_DN2047_c0_g1_i1.p1  ORF type:complete len:137 (-),score=11.97 TRINITY_DN2047_c0_g1_i1:40-450(-)
MSSVTSFLESLPVRPLLGALATTWGIIGFAWWWDQNSPLGWWTLKPRTADERAMAKYYERGIPPFPGDGDAVERYFQKGGKENTVLPPRPGRPRARSEDAKVQMYRGNVEREAFRLWLRMRREAARDLREQGLDID